MQNGTATLENSLVISYKIKHDLIINSVQLLSCVQLFATPWTTALQASLSITNSWSLLKLMSIKLVMPSNHLILCHPLLLLSSIFPNIRAFSYHVCMLGWLSYIQLCATYGLQRVRLICPWDFPGKNTMVGFCALLQGIFPTQNWTHISYVYLHWHMSSLPLAPPGKPWSYHKIH